MAGLTQQRFAQLLVEAQSAVGMGNDVLAGLTGIDATTISRYRSPTYRSGPPSVTRRGLLERAMGLPEGYLSGGVRLSRESLQRLGVERGRTGPPGGAGGQTHTAAGQSGARTSDSASAVLERQPTGEAALRFLEYEIVSALRYGRIPTLEELREWLELVRGAASAGESAGAEPSTLDVMAKVDQAEGRSDTRPRPGPASKAGHPKVSGG